MKVRLLGCGLLLVAAVFAGGRMLAARDAPKDDGPKAKCDALMTKLKADGVEGFATAFEAEFLPGAAKPTDGATLLKLQRQQATAVNGKPLGDIELVRTETIGKTYVRLTYLEMFERHGWVWQFTLVRSPAGWQFCDVTWTAELAKIYALFAVSR